MAPGRHARTYGDVVKQQGSKGPKPKTDKPPEWLSKELIIAADCDGDMYGKLERAIMADKALLEDLKFAPDGRRRTLLRQLKSKILDSRKIERNNRMPRTRRKL